MQLSKPISTLSSETDLDRLSDRLLIREFRSSDAKAVSEVTASAYAESADPEDVYNYWAQGLHANSTSYMVAEIDGRVVGTQPLEYFDYSADGRSFKGGILTGVAVHPEFRRMGIFTKLVRACEDAAWRCGASFITTMPNDRSKPGFVKMGYVDLGQRSLAVRVLDGGKLGKRKLPWIGKPIGVIGGLLQNTFFWTREQVFGELAEIGAPNPNWEALFYESHTATGGIGIKRSYDWLEWRYKKMPIRKYRYFELRSPTHECIAACITTQETRSSLNIAYLMEIAATTKPAYRSLVRMLFRKLKHDGIHVLASVLSSPAATRQLRASGMVFVPHWAPIKRFYTVVRFNPTLTVEESWKSIDGWNQWLGDWDSL